MRARRGEPAQPAPRRRPSPAGPGTRSTAPAHRPTGSPIPPAPTDIVLRFDEAGGFVPPEFLAARLPFFTLYGDGRVVFVQTSAAAAASRRQCLRGPPAADRATLSEEQVQALLEFALNDGGLAVAQERTTTRWSPDAPTAVFTINADNDTKTVSATRSASIPSPVRTAAILAQLAKLGERLRDFDQGGTSASQPYDADRYRGVILESQGVQGVPIRDWPWTDITPADFRLPADANALPQGTAHADEAEAAAVGVDGFENGVSSGIWLRAADGKVYSLVIRPLLPDETPSQRAQSRGRPGRQPTSAKRSPA